MPQYILELTWTERGRTNPVPVADRRQKAMAVAAAHGVTGWDGSPIGVTDTDAGCLWKVEGEDADVRATVAEWEGHGNVTVEADLV